MLVLFVDVGWVPLGHTREFFLLESMLLNHRREFETSSCSRCFFSYLEFERHLKARQGERRNENEALVHVIAPALQGHKFKSTIFTITLKITNIYANKIDWLIIKYWKSLGMIRNEEIKFSSEDDIQKNLIMVRYLINLITFYSYMMTIAHNRQLSDLIESSIR